MRPLSSYITASFPALLGVLLVLLSATPLSGGAISYTPNIAFLMTLVLATHTRHRWPPAAAFGLGILQDVLFATPLGAQGLLALLLLHMLQLRQARRVAPVPFRVHWVHAGVVLLALHVALWGVLEAVGQTSTPLMPLIITGAINALWYPLFALALRREELA